MNKTGLFITFEGGECCGKTSQIKLLKEYFQKEHIDCIFVKEPGGTVIGEKLRDFLLHDKTVNPEPKTEFLLFLASRVENYYKNIKPALEQGKIVIADRFYDSTAAYQSSSGVFDIEQILKINKLFLENLTPDITFYLKLSPSEAFKRKNQSERDKIENLGLEYHNKVFEAYNKLSQIEKERYHVIDASLDVDKIFEQIKNKISKETYFYKKSL